MRDDDIELSRQGALMSRTYDMKPSFQEVEAASLVLADTTPMSDVHIHSGVLYLICPS